MSFTSSLPVEAQELLLKRYPVSKIGGQDAWLHFSAFARRRDDQANQLEPGERFLTPWDDIQEGDSYMANGHHWWKFAVRLIGRPIPLEYFCYTPKGKRPTEVTTTTAESQRKFDLNL